MRYCPTFAERKFGQCTSNARTSSAPTDNRRPDRETQRSLETTGDADGLRVRRAGVQAGGGLARPRSTGSGRRRCSGSRCATRPRRRSRPCRRRSSSATSRPHRLLEQPSRASLLDAGRAHACDAVCGQRRGGRACPPSRRMCARPQLGRDLSRGRDRGAGGVPRARRRGRSGRCAGLTVVCRSGCRLGRHQLLPRLRGGRERTGGAGREGHVRHPEGRLRRAGAAGRAAPLDRDPATCALPPP